MSSETIDDIIEWFRLLFISTLIIWVVIWVISALFLGIYVLISGIITGTHLFLFIRWVLAICLGALVLNLSCLLFMEFDHATS